MARQDPLPPPTPPPANPPPAQVERIVGHGRVLRDAVPVFDVDYDVMISRGTAQPTAAVEPGLPPGPRQHDLDDTAPDITGQLIGALFTAEQLQGVHTLVLEDGREFDFRVIQPDTNEIVAVSPLRAGGRERTSTRTSRA